MLRRLAAVAALALFAVTLSFADDIQLREVTEDAVTAVLPPLPQGDTAIAAGEAPTAVPPNTFVDEIREVRSSVELLGLGPELRIVGNKVFDGSILTAKKIRFAPGARLIFTNTARSRRNTLIVVTEQMINENQERPGTITWDRHTSAPEGGGLGGEGVPGSNGGDRSGGNGGPGGSGAAGRRGSAGESAPNILIVSKSAPAPGGIVIDFRGQNGGKGGVGQKGGRGGKGGSGRPASQTLFNCSRGAGDGGTGGAGGRGGNGGPGGAGGRGGQVSFFTVAGNLPALSQRFTVHNSGGTGGDGGAAGAGGEGGDGGPGGQEQRPLCRGNGSQGRKGANGPNGGPGTKGANGAAGDFLNRSTS